MRVDTEKIAPSTESGRRPSGATPYNSRTTMADPFAHHPKTACAARRNPQQTAATKPLLRVATTSFCVTLRPMQATQRTLPKHPHNPPPNSPTHQNEGFGWWENGGNGGGGLEGGGGGGGRMGERGEMMENICTTQGVAGK